MPSRRNDRQNEEVFPRTDFREFIDSIQGTNAVGNRFLRSTTLQDDPNLVSFTTDVKTARRGVATAEALLERRRELDAHYGWVLASDAALVYESMGGKNGQGAEWARLWMKDIHDEYERVGQALLEAKVN